MGAAARWPDDDEDRNGNFSNQSIENKTFTHHAFTQAGGCSI